MFHEEKAPVSCSCNTPTQHAIIVQLTGIHSKLWYLVLPACAQWVGPLFFGKLSSHAVMSSFSFFSNDAFIQPVYCSPSVRPNDGWDLNLYDDDIARGGDIIGNHLGGFGHLQGCGQNSSKARVSAMNYIPRKATTIGWLQTKKAAITPACIIWI